MRLGFLQSWTQLIDEPERQKEVVGCECLGAFQAVLRIYIILPNIQEMELFEAKRPRANRFMLDASEE